MPPGPLGRLATGAIPPALALEATHRSGLHYWISAAGSDGRCCTDLPGLRGKVTGTTPGRSTGAGGAGSRRARRLAGHPGLP